MTATPAGRPAGCTTPVSPGDKTLADFDFAANPAINPATVNTLARCAWVRRGESLCLIGDSGTGKTHCKTPDRVLTE